VNPPQTSSSEADETRVRNMAAEFCLQASFHARRVLLHAVNLRYETNEGESWRIRTNKEIEDILEGADIVKFIKSLRLRRCGHIERMNNERIPKNNDN
jgi:hypothetical protein